MEKQRVQTPDESTPYAIEMLHITKRFPGIIANDDITLQLRHGEIHALLGENGAGKSTFLRILSGELEPTTGTVTIPARAAPVHLEAGSVQVRCLSCAGHGNHGQSAPV